MLNSNKLISWRGVFFHAALQSYIHERRLLARSLTTIQILTQRMCLTNWDWDKMDAISQTAFSSTFSFSLKIASKGPINNVQALIKMMAWRRPCGKPLSEAMIVSLLIYSCVTQPEWVKREHSMIISAECAPIAYSTITDIMNNVPINWRLYPDHTNVELWRDVKRTDTKCPVQISFFC